MSVSSVGCVTKGRYLKRAKITIDEISNEKNSLDEHAELSAKKTGIGPTANERHNRNRNIVNARTGRDERTGDHSGKWSPVTADALFRR
jgi:hypothetical protein